MIYSPTVNDFPPYKLGAIRKPYLWLKELETIFLYTELDSALYGMELDQSLTADQWKYLRDCSTAKLLISFIGDYLNWVDLSKIRAALDKNVIPSERVWFLTQDSNYTKFVVDFFKDRPGVQVTHYNHLLKKIKIPPIPSSTYTHRFSVLSRNYRTWRAELFARMVNADIMPNTIYSFHNIDPYKTTVPPVGLEQIMIDVKQRGVVPTPKLAEWLWGVPYELPNSHITDKWANATYSAVQNSAINILIESHFISMEHYHGRWNRSIREYSPGFATEKTYKTLACARPFISVNTPYFLEDLRNMGFKTFSPYIDESYDTIENDFQRMLAILTELDRLNKMDPKEFDQLVLTLKPIAEHNYARVLELHQEQTLVDQWSWVTKYLR